MPLTTLPIFPALPGQGFPTKTPTFATRKQRSVSGRTLTIADQGYPIWKFSVPFEFLRDGNDARVSSGRGVGLTEVRSLLSIFWVSLGGKGVFAFDDPTDNFVVGLVSPTGVCLGGDGVTTQFQLSRQILGGAGQLSEPITAPNVVSHVYVNGVDPATWSVSPTGMVTFLSPPANGAAISWSGTFYFPCRFSDDNIDITWLMVQVATSKEIKIESVLP